MQTLKRRRVRRVHGRLPAHATCVPLDFETGCLHEVLGGVGFDARAIDVYWSSQQNGADSRGPVGRQAEP